MNPAPRPANSLRDAPLLAATIVMIAMMGLVLVGGVLGWRCSAAPLTI